MTCDSANCNAVAGNSVVTEVTGRELTKRLIRRRLEGPLLNRREHQEGYYRLPFRNAGGPKNQARAMEVKIKNSTTSYSGRGSRRITCHITKLIDYPPRG